MSSRSSAHKVSNFFQVIGSLSLFFLYLPAYLVGFYRLVLFVCIVALGLMVLAEKIGQEVNSFSEEFLGVALYESSIKENNHRNQGGAVNSNGNDLRLESINNAASLAATRFAALLPDSKGGGTQEMLAASSGSASSSSASSGSADVAPEVMSTDAPPDVTPMQQYQRTPSHIKPKQILIGKGSTPAGTQTQCSSITQRVDANTQADAKKVGGLKEQGKRIEPEQDSAQSALVATTKTTDREPHV